MSHKAPWSARCSMWWLICLFVGRCSTLGGVEAFLRLCWPRKSFLDFPRFLRRLGFTNVAEHVVMNTCRQEIHHSACGLLPCWVFGNRWSGLIFLSSFDIASITLADKVLVYLLLPQCKVFSIQLLARESAPHLSIHYVDVDFCLLLLPSWTRAM